MTTKTAVTVAPEPGQFAIFQENDFGMTVAEAMAANLDGEALSAWDLPRITVPGGGGLAWTVPTADGKQRPAEAIEGVIVHLTKSRSYWSQEMGQGETKQPDCSSLDTYIGRGLFGPDSERNPTGFCDTCPMSQWGSGKDGDGQACKLSKLLFVLRPEDRTPIVVNVPRTSLGNLKKYMMQVGGMGRPFWSVITRFTLERQQSKKSGIAYSQTRFDVAASLSPDVSRQFQAIGASLKPALEQGAVEATYERRGDPDDLPDDDE